MADKKYFRIRQPGTSLDPVPPSKTFQVYMKDIDAPDAVDSNQEIIFPLKRPATGVPLFLEIVEDLGCCELPSYYFYYGYNPGKISPGNFVILYVQGGCPPFDWAVSQPGYSFAQNQTTERWNTLTAEPTTAAGDIQVTITDVCGTVVAGRVQNEGVLATVIDSLLDALFGQLDESYFTTAFNSRIDGIEGLASQVNTKVATTVYEAAITDPTTGLIAKTAAAELLLSTHGDTLDNLTSEFMVKLDVNGYISGFGIVGQTDYSEAVFYVDKFMIVNPGDEPTQVFVVGEINGSYAVGIHGSLIVDNSILARHLSVVDAVITDSAQIGNVLESTNWVEDVSGWKIDKSGWAQFNNVEIRNDLMSSNYSAGVSGWKLGYGGTLEIHNITIYDSAGNILLSSGEGIDFSGYELPDLGLGDMAFIDQITAANISTFIAAAAIGEAYIGNAAVGTLKIQDQAVIIPISAYTAGDVAVSDSSETTIQSATITVPSGSSIPVEIMASTFLPDSSHFELDEFENQYLTYYPIILRLYRGATLLREKTFLSAGVTIPALHTETLSAGTYTYYLKAQRIDSSYGISVSERYLGIKGIRK